MWWFGLAFAFIIPNLGLKDYLVGPFYQQTFVGEDSSLLNPMLQRLMRSCTPIRIQNTQSAETSSLIDEIGKVVDTAEKIVLIGEKLWKIIEKGKPVYQWQGNWVAVLPDGVNCWDELTQWKTPKVANYRVYYRNYLGMKVIDFGYRVELLYGGAYQDRGAYIGYVSVIPTNVKVSWGFGLNAAVKIQAVVNVGSNLNPVAGVSFAVTHTVTSPVQTHQDSQAYFVTGLGEINRLQ